MITKVQCYFPIPKVPYEPKEIFIQKKESNMQNEYFCEYQRMYLVLVRIPFTVSNEHFLRHSETFVSAKFAEMRYLGVVSRHGIGGNCAWITATITTFMSEIIWHTCASILIPNYKQIASELGTSPVDVPNGTVTTALGGKLINRLAYVCRWQ